MKSLPDSLSGPQSAATLRLRHLVDAAQKIEIGQRIRELRENSAETNRSIADHCGVSVEAVRNWIAGKGIAYENAEKVAELFDRDVDWIWRGDRGPAPDPFASESAATADELLAEVRALRLELLAEIGKVQTALEAQPRRRATGGRRRATNGN